MFKVLLSNLGLQQFISSTASSWVDDEPEPQHICKSALFNITCMIDNRNQLTMKQTVVPSV